MENIGILNEIIFLCST